jgi:hypothetical protein
LLRKAEERLQQELVDDKRGQLNAQLVAQEAELALLENDKLGLLATLDNLKVLEAKLVGASDAASRACKVNAASNLTCRFGSFCSSTYGTLRKAMTFESSCRD